MDTEHLGVAISTTGDEHRLSLLARCVKGWDEALPDNSSMFITVDGDEDACHRVYNVVSNWTGSIFRVGQPYLFPSLDTGYGTRIIREGRLGVAVNKNTGIELLMNGAKAAHLFLSDDDTWPLRPEALDLHVSGNRGLAHSMVCWGRHRLGWINAGYAEWTWPRGSMIYTGREVVEQVGGMVEAFGPGGHEHVEWSRRIHQAGLTPAAYPSPLPYSASNAMGAADYWYAEDMPKKGEGMAAYAARKHRTTSVRRLPEDGAMIDEIMRSREGSSAFVPYVAGENGRASATLYHNRRA